MLFLPHVCARVPRLVAVLFARPWPWASSMHAHVLLADPESMPLHAVHEHLTLSCGVLLRPRLAMAAPARCKCRMCP